MAEDDNERQADALRKMSEGGGPPPPQPPVPPKSAALFRQARPATPGADAPAAGASSARPARPDRPSAPPQTAPASDVVAMDVPPTENASAATSISPEALEASRALERKRTMIPVLLTTGMLVTITGLARWVVAEDSAFRLFNNAASLAMLGLGGLLLGVAVLNMLQVRDQLAANAPQGPR